MIAGLMRDRELYAQILGVSKPWSVSRVELALDEGEVRVWVERSEGEPLRCPECDQKGAKYDSAERRWRHLDTCQYQTILIAQIQRIRCREHGVRQIEVAWAEPGSRLTALFEALVIDWLLQTGNMAAVARGLALSWDQVDGIQRRAVARGLARRGAIEVPAAIGVDETSFQRRHEYVTTVTSLGQPRALYVADGRGREALDGFYEQLTPEGRAKIELVAMDMWEPYIQSTRAPRTIPRAKLSLTSFTFCSTSATR